MPTKKTTTAKKADEAAPEAVQTAAAAEATNASARGLDLVIDVALKLTVEIGGSKLLLRDVLQLGKGSVVELDRESGEPADIFVNGRLIAKGDVTTVDDRIAVRIVEVVSDAARAQ